MNFAESSHQALPFERQVAIDAERLRWKREKASQRRKASQDGFYDDETVVHAKPTVCIIEGCDRKVRALWFCERDYKRERRRSGRRN